MEIIAEIVKAAGTTPKPTEIDTASAMLEVYVSDMLRHVTQNLAPRFIP